MKRTCILTLSIAMLAQASIPVQAQAEDAKWFVLRIDNISSCWTGLLIQVNGEYAHSFAQLASPAYKTKKEALKREKALEASGSCRVEQ